MSTNPFATSSPPPVFGEQAPVAGPVGGAWGPASTPLDEEDEPFTAAHLAAANEAAVPAVGGAGGGAGSSRPAHTALTFTESTAAVPSASSMGGRVGQPSSSGAAPVSPVPRVGSAADQALLASSPGPSAPLGGNGGMAGGPAGAPQEDPSKFAFYNIKRYRGLFNVDTSDVLARLLHAVLLFFRGDFLQYTDGNPDLYGPFWVASTLIFVTAAAGNCASYIDWTMHKPEGSTSAGWYYDVDKVGGSFGLFYGYVGVVGLILYFVLRWFKAGVSLASVWCVYGYALAAFIPISLVCVVPIESVRWAVVGAATLTSGTFIMLSLRAPIHEAAGAKALPLYIGMIALHAGLGLALKLYFFRYKDIPMP
ncbi:hypothetical protein ABPG75_013494 [Micractinium tetrahymenae]